jgi:hypothetical protein
MGMATQSTCNFAGCTRAASYRFVAGTQDSGARCGRHALVYWPVCGRATKVALVVGTILMVINQGDVLLSGHLTALVAAKIGLTYVIPYSVSSYSALAANRLHNS